jgi:hypothetical protein
MPWTSNRTANNIVVTLAGGPGGPQAFIVQPASAVMETLAANWWMRGGDMALRLMLNGMPQGPVNVSPDGHVNIYANLIKIF